MKSVSCSALADAIVATCATTPEVPGLDLVRRVLAKRHPAALRELDEALAIFARAGESELAPWLERPPEIDLAETDPLVTLAQTEATLRSQLQRLPPGHVRLAGTAQAITTIAKARESIARGRPQPESEDQVDTRIRGAATSAVAWIERHVAEADAAWEGLLPRIRRACRAADPGLADDLDALTRAP